MITENIKSLVRYRIEQADESLEASKMKQIIKLIIRLQKNSLKRHLKTTFKNAVIFVNGLKTALTDMIGCDHV